MNLRILQATPIALALAVASVFGAQAADIKVRARAPDGTEFVWTANGCHGKPARPDCWGVPDIKVSTPVEVQASRARLLRGAGGGGQFKWTADGCHGKPARPDCWGVPDKN